MWYSRVASSDSASWSWLSKEKQRMTTDKIRLGVIGANPNVGWAPRAHLPALVASPDVELTAVCTTRSESAAASAQKYGARMAFHDYSALLACPDIDAVAVVLRVPSH